MKIDPVLTQIIDELTKIHHCHTVILYGSRARGDSTPTSDYDVAGITKSGEKKRIARFDEIHKVYLDIFIYPEIDFSDIQPDHLRFADGIIIYQTNPFGEALISKIKQMAAEPELISDDEIAARKVWYDKMLARASNRDLEGKYRHVWTLFSLLEDYFVFRGIRYQGPKNAFQYLEMHDQATLALFHEALTNSNDIEALNLLIRKVTM